METLQGPLEGIILVVQMHKILFTPFTFPKGAVLPIFVKRYFFDVPLFLENHSIASHYTLQMVLVLLRGLSHQRTLFTATPPLLGTTLSI